MLDVISCWAADKMVVDHPTACIVAYIVVGPTNRNPLQHQALEQFVLVVDRHAPLLVVVGI